MKIVAAAKILKANDQLAAETRAKLDAAGVFAVNLVGSPGAGKTTLLEALLAHWKGAMPTPGVSMAPSVRPPRPAVIEGDIAGSIDAERIEKLGVPVVQVNTQGACHLDASMVAAALVDLDLGAVDLLLIENVGNLVCTAGFDLGERLRILVLSASEGDDKAVKYPAIFQSSQALCLTKTDLLPQTNFDVQRITADYSRLAPRGVVFQVAAIRGEGIPAAADWLAEQCRGAAP
jgi:hydrogenase nickel incorporation protein HypB